MSSLGASPNSLRLRDWKIVAFLHPHTPKNKKQKNKKMVLLFIFVCESVDNLGIFDDMKQNNTKTLETLRLKLFHHKGIYPNINFLLKIKTMLTLFQPSSTQSNTKTRVFKLNYNIILNLLLIRSDILLLQTNQS